MEVDPDRDPLPRAPPPGAMDPPAEMPELPLGLITEPDMPREPLNVLAVGREMLPAGTRLASTAELGRLIATD